MVILYVTATSSSHGYLLYESLMLAWVPVVPTRIRRLTTVHPPQHPPAFKLNFWFPFYTIGNSPVPLNVIHSFHICHGVSILSFAWPILVVLSEWIQARMFSEPVDIVPGPRCQACSGSGRGTSKKRRGGGEMGPPHFHSHGSFRRCRRMLPPGNGWVFQKKETIPLGCEILDKGLRAVSEGGDLVPFVVVVKHTAVDATYCCQALPMVQDVLRHW